MAIRKEKDAQSFGLGDAVIVATTIEKKRQELSKEFRSHGSKGVVSQSTIQKRKEREAAAIQKAHDRAYNPRIKGLEGIEGITTAADGTIGLAELREQRPDVLKLRPAPLPGRESSGLKKFHDKMTAAGRKDRYGHNFD